MIGRYYAIDGDTGYRFSSSLARYEWVRERPLTRSAVSVGYFIAHYRETLTGHDMSAYERSRACYEAGAVDVYQRRTHPLWVEVAACAVIVLSVLGAALVDGVAL